MDTLFAVRKKFQVCLPELRGTSGPFYRNHPLSPNPDAARIYACRSAQVGVYE